MKVSLTTAWVWFFISILFLLTSCAPKQPGMVRDIHAFPQDAAYYIDDDPGRMLINAEKQAELYQQFLKMFYMPWNRVAPKFTASEVFWGLDLYGAREIYSENKLPFLPGWIEEMEQKSDIPAYPSLHIPAISVTHASMRVLPTQRPVFYNPQRPGEGFPFDYMQNTLLPAGTPLLITHVSRDRRWALTETDFAAGWIRWNDLAVVDEGFKRMYQDKPLLGFVSDDVPVAREDGMFAVSGRVGMALPLALEQGDTDFWRVLVPVRDHLGQAKVISARVSKSNVKEMPFSPSQKNFAGILNSMMGQAYGWGGLFENRDCSALIKDALAGFGFFLPRNSRGQARAGHSISLEGLSGQQKKDMITAHGKPWLTILYMPGHVMLYIGQDPVTGSPTVYHSMWGLRTWRPFREDGRWIIGRTVITSLEPGREMHMLARPGGLLVERLSTMVLLSEQ